MNCSDNRRKIIRLLLLLILLASKNVYSQLDEINLFEQNRTSIIEIDSIVATDIHTNNLEELAVAIESYVKNVNSNEYLRNYILIHLAAVYRDFDFKKSGDILSIVKVYVDRHTDYPLLNSFFLLEVSTRYNMQGDCDQLTPLFEKVDYYIPQIHDAEYRNSMYTKILQEKVNAYNCQEKYEESIRLLKDNEGLLLSSDDPEVNLYYLNTMGYLNVSIGQMNEAIRYYKDALEYMENGMYNQLYYASVYNSLGVIYFMQNDQKNSLYYMEKALEIYNVLPVNDDQLTFLYNMSKIYSHYGLYSRAIDMSQKMLTKSKDEGFLLYEAMAENALSEIYFKQKNYEKALLYSDSSVAVFRRINDSENLVSALDLNSKILMAQSRFEDAVKVLQEKISVSDSLNKTGVFKNLQDNLIRYETEKKERRIAEMKQTQELTDLKVKTQNLYIIILISGAILVFTIFSFLWANQRRVNRYNKLTLLSQLSRSQFNPHFINNAFASLQALAVQHDMDEMMIDYISGISRFSRKVLESSFRDEWSLQDELQMIDNYIRIQSSRMPGVFCFTQNVDFVNGEISQIKIPSVIIQPLLENAIEHGGYNLSQKGEIVLDVTHSSNQLIISLTNNKFERVSKVNKRELSEPSRGLEILEKRLMLHARLNKRTYLFDLNIDDPEKVIVKISLPLIRYESTNRR